MKTKDIDSKSKRKPVNELAVPYVPGGGIAFRLAYEAWKRYAGAETVLIFKDMRAEKDLFVYAPMVKLSQSQMQEHGTIIEDQTGRRLSFEIGINTHNYAAFLVSYNDKYMISYNYWLDTMWS